MNGLTPITRLSRHAIIGCVLSLLPLAANANAYDKLQLLETPQLQPLVAAKKLPPVTERVPDSYQIVNPANQPDFKPGQPGGELRLLMAKPKDIRQMVIYGYARLVGYDQQMQLQPDILQSVEVEEGRTFTLRLRPGHRWSDGSPFTSEDFRYYWEDIANNPELTPTGPNRFLLVQGQKPQVTFPDLYTVRYSWHAANPLFLTALAAPKPLFIYRPAHYLKQYHARYQSPEVLQKLVAKKKMRNWMGLHFSKDRPYKATNPDLPTLQPWHNTTYPPAQRYVFKRNPFYHRVDENGHQLPYIDKVVINLAASKLIAAKTGSGESDLQARYLRMDNYTFLKQSDKRYNYSVNLWDSSKGSHMALYPNLNSNDLVWRKLLRNLSFRRALSLAINRHEINQVIFFGLASESNNTVLPTCNFFHKKFQHDWALFNINKANAMLDALGLTKRNEQGIRLLPDGRPMEILVQTAGEDTEQTDILELIHDSWLQAGIKLYAIPSSREVFRNRIFAGDAIMAIWSGLANALPTADMPPNELAPTAQDQYQWPKWGQYFETKGRAGEAPDMPEAKALLDLYNAWLNTVDLGQKQQIWHKMLAIFSTEMFSIGLINRVKQPVVVSNSLNNVPKEGFYEFYPSAYFGIYRPDTFWFDEERRH